MDLRRAGELFAGRALVSVLCSLCVDLLNSILGRLSPVPVSTSIYIYMFFFFRVFEGVYLSTE